MEKTKNLSLSFLIIALVITIALAVWLQINLFNTNNAISELKELFMISNERIFLSETLDIEKYENYINDYILNQKNIDKLWWNTIFNQSGLSIIFTAIILFLTITISWITQNQIESKYKSEIQNVKNYSTDLMNDVLLISNSHSGSFGAFLMAEEHYLQNAISKVNIFNNLQILKREQLLDLYHKDLEGLAHQVYSALHKIIHKNKDLEVIKRFESIMLQVENDYDKKELSPYVIDIIIDKKSTYPKEVSDEYMEADLKLIQHIEEKCSKYERKYK